MGKVIFIVVIIILLLWLYNHFFKIPKFNNLALISGGVKSGKSTMAIHFAIKTYKKVHLRWRIRNFFCKLLKRSPLEEPLLYSNIPIYKKYTPISRELLSRSARFRYGSVIYLGEASLISNSMNFKQLDLNEQQLLFYKLIAHSTRGGYCIVDTQSISDLHYSLKRSVSNYFYIHHTVNLWFLPWLICYVRELVYSEDNNSINNFTEDVEQSLKRVIIPKRVWRYFDCYCYSCLTDDLPITDFTVVPVTYKADDIVSFNTYQNLYKGVSVYEETNDTSDLL